MLDREAILAADDLPLERVEVAQWGGAVWVRGLTSNERDAYEAALVETDASGVRRVNRDHARAMLLVRALRDEHGSRLFTDEDVLALGAKSGAVTDRLWDVAARLTGLVAAAEVEAAMEDFGQARTDVSSTD